MLIALQQRVQRPQVGGQAAENLVLLQLIGHRDLHGAIEGQFALVDAAQHLEGRLHHVVALQHLAAEPGPGELDLPGQGHFLLAAQQGDLAHLRQVHAHRIIRPRLVLFDAFQEAVDVDVQVQVEVGAEFRDLVGEFFHVRIVEVDDRVFGQLFDRLFHPRGRVVVEFVQ